MQEFKALREWIKKARNYYSEEEIKEILLKKGWKKEEIVRASKRKQFFVLPLLLSIVVFISLFAYFSFFKFKKNNEERQEREYSDTERAIIKIANAFDMGSLHAVPFTKNYPKIEFSVNDKSYFVSVEEGKMILKNVSNPDLRIRTTESVMLRIMKTESIKETLKEEIEKGSIIVDVVADEVTLAAKGYLSLYKTITSSVIGKKRKELKFL